MNFIELDKVQAKQQIAVLGNVPARFESDRAPAIETVVGVDRDIEVLMDDGRAVTKKTVVCLYKPEVGHVVRGDVITLYPEVLEKLERFSVGDVISDDGVIIEAWVRVEKNG